MGPDWPRATGRRSGPLRTHEVMWQRTLSKKQSTGALGVPLAAKMIGSVCPSCSGNDPGSDLMVTASCSPGTKLTPVIPVIRTSGYLNQSCQLLTGFARWYVMEIVPTKPPATLFTVR